MRAGAFGIVLLTVGCTGGGGGGNDDDQLMSADTSPPVVSGSGAGDVVVEMNGAWIGAPADTRVVGVFTDPSSPVTNLAQCLGGQQFCLREPRPQTVNASVDVEPFDEMLLDTLSTVSAGPELTLGDWSAPFFFDTATNLAFYSQISPGTLTSEPPIDLDLAGDVWPATRAADIVEMPDPVG
ncbi:MAG: hypothetical protein AAF211_25520, partial [Myxococcota bacterium]